MLKKQDVRAIQIQTPDDEKYSVWDEKYTKLTLTAD